MLPLPHLQDRVRNSTYLPGYEIMRFKSSVKCKKQKLNEECFEQFLAHKKLNQSMAIISSNFSRIVSVWNLSWVFYLTVEIVVLIIASKEAASSMPHLERHSHSYMWKNINDPCLFCFQWRAANSFLLNNNLWCVLW